MKNKCICLLISFAFGLAVGCLPKFIWDFHVSVYSLITFIITIGVTIYVAKIIQRSTQYKVSQNQMLVSKVNDIDNLVKNIHSLIQSDGFSYKQLIASFQILYLNAEWIINGINEIHPQLNNRESSSLLKEIRKIQKISTYTPPGKESSEISISDDKVSYTQSKRDEVVKVLSKLRASLFNLEVDIYRQ